MKSQEQFEVLKQQMNKTDLKLTKIQDSDTDGQTTEAFHSKCDNVSGTIVLAKTEGKDDVIGGYASKAWNTPEETREGEYGEILTGVWDQNAFVFNLTRKSKHENYSQCIQ